MGDTVPQYCDSMDFLNRLTHGLRLNQPERGLLYPQQPQVPVAPFMAGAVSPHIDAHAQAYYQEVLRTHQHILDNVHNENHPIPFVQNLHPQVYKAALFQQWKLMMIFKHQQELKEREAAEMRRQRDMEKLKQLVSPENTPSLFNRSPSITPPSESSNSDSSNFPHADGSPSPPKESPYKAPSISGYRYAEPNPDVPRPRRGASGTRPEKTFTCQICSRSFGYKHVLHNHLRTHTGEKPYKCDKCEKRFTRDHHLKTHFRLHTGEKPYICRYCSKEFVQVANLRRHIRTHTGEKPFGCLDCEKTFPDKNQLKSHQVIHRPDNTCHVCKVIFPCHNDFIAHPCPGMPVHLSPNGDAKDEYQLRLPSTPESLDGERKRNRSISPQSSDSSSSKKRGPSPKTKQESKSPEQVEPEDLSLNK